MRIHVFGNFIQKGRLPSSIDLTIDEFVYPRSEKEKETLETVAKLFYEPGEDPTLVVELLLAEGFVLIDGDPYTTLIGTRQRYKRMFKEQLSPYEFISRRDEFPGLEVEFNGESFDIYSIVPDGVEKYARKVYCGDRMIFSIVQRFAQAYSLRPLRLSGNGAPLVPFSGLSGPERPERISLSE